MGNVQLSKTQSVLLNLIGHSLFSMPLSLDDGIDWRAVLRESDVQSVSLIALRNHSELPIDSELRDSLKAYLKKCTVANVNCISGHKHLHKLMSDGGVKYCILKGVASAAYYPDPLLRNMGDVDFYVSPDDYERAKDILLSDGFELVGDEELHHHVTFKKATMYLELHVSPIAVPNEDMRPLFSEYWSDIRESASLYSDALGTYVLPSEFHHGFVILTHFQVHLVTYGIGLRHLCDLAVFFNSFDGEKFADVFESRLRRVGLWRLAQALALVSVKYLGMPHRAWMGKEYGIADALLEDILRGGNFGKGADTDRHREVMFVSRSESGVVRRSRIRTMVGYVNKRIRANWTRAEKCPILYPIGWIYFPIRFVIRLIFGRVRTNVIRSYKHSGERIDLYGRLRLFEPDVDGD